MSCYSTDKHAVIHTLYGDRVSFEIIDVACGFIVNPQSNTKCGEVSTVHWVIVKHPGRVIVDLNLCSCHAISIVDDFLNKSRKEMLEYNSLINIKPRQGNRNMEIENEEIKKKILEIVNNLVE